jgi:hypothetical protein
VVANGRGREWVAANMKDLIQGPPEVTMGEMLVDAATFAETFGGPADEAADKDAVPHDAID